MKKRIKLLKQWGEYAAGSVLEVDEAAYKSLPTGDFEDYSNPSPVVSDVSAIVTDAATKAVKEALAAVEKQTRGQIRLQVVSDPTARGFKTLAEQMFFARDAEVGRGRVNGRHFSEDPRFKVLSDSVRTKDPGDATGLSEAIDSDGGFLVQQDFAAELFALAHATGILIGKVQHVPISANANGLRWNAVDETSRADGSRRGGIVVYWTDEAEAAARSKPRLAKRTMDLQKLTGLYYATEELLQDAAALTALVGAWFGEEFGFKLDDSIVRGSGAGCPVGLLVAGCLVTVAKETGQAAATLLSENIVKMYARLYAPCMPRAEWYINQDILPQLMLMKMTIGTAGVPLYMPPGGLSVAPYGTILGRPVVPIEQAATLGTLGDIIFGDLSQYLMIDKGGVTAANSIHLKFLEGETAFRYVMRTNGQPKWQTALTPHSGSGNTQSPFVTLAARA